MRLHVLFGVVALVAMAGCSGIPPSDDKVAEAVGALYTFDCLMHDTFETGFGDEATTYIADVFTYRAACDSDPDVKDAFRVLSRVQSECGAATVESDRWVVIILC